MVTHYNDILAEINSNIEGKVYQRVENANDATINYRHYGIKTKSEPVRLISNIQQERRKVGNVDSTDSTFLFCWAAF